MRLVVKQDGRVVSEFRSSEGPIYIGRQAQSQVLLAERAVSRQHAVIFTDSGGKWMVEDLDSANKTYLNDQAIHRAQIKDGDRLRIGSFVIEIHVEVEEKTARRPSPEDTLTTAPRKPQIIVRKPGAAHNPDIRLPGRRMEDFLEATEAICKAQGPDEVIEALVKTVLKQFGAFRAWCALRNQPTGPMTSHAGRRHDGGKVELGDIELRVQISHAVDEKRFLLLPQVPAQRAKHRIRSAMIAPILDPSGCFGVSYVDNSEAQEGYGLSDLDYLMLLAIHTAAIVENF